MTPVAGWAVAIAMMAAPGIAGAGDGEFNPCKNKGPRRIAIVFARGSGLLGDGECKGTVYPAKKTVCEGDTVNWSVINGCDLEEVSNIRLDGLERVAEKCTVVRELQMGGASEIRCRLRLLPENVKQEYQVAGRVGKSRMVVDPELDIRRPR
jgi:hypothetical protein